MVRISEIEEPKPADTPVKAVTPSRENFDKLLKGILEVFPDEEMRKGVQDGLTRTYEAPPKNNLGSVLRKGLDDDQVRRILFFPGKEEMQLYPLMISSPPAGCGADDPRTKVQRQALIMLYLAHVKSWSLIREFIMADGLKVLVDLFTLNDLHLRGQVLEIFLSITDCSFFDWCAPPPYPDVEVHKKMFALCETGIVSNLVANTGGSFPGGSFIALQILVFFLSWVRMFYSVGERKLTLSKKVLCALKEWQELATANEEERRLARTVYEDFARFGPNTDIADDADGAALFGPQTLKEPRLNIEVEVKAMDEIGDMTSGAGAGDNAPVDESADAHKGRGNKAFQAGNFNEAVTHYSAAIAADGDNSPVFYSNRAAAYMKLAATASGGEKTNFLVSAVEDCEAANKIDFNFMKGYFRKAQALHQLGRPNEALTAAKRAFRLEPDIEETMELVEKLEAIVGEQGPASAPDSSKAGSAQKENVASVAATTGAARQTTNVCMETESEVAAEADAPQNNAPAQDISEECTATKQETTEEKPRIVVAAQGDETRVDDARCETTQAPLSAKDKASLGTTSGATSERGDRATESSQGEAKDEGRDDHKFYGARAAARLHEAASAMDEKSRTDLLESAVSDCDSALLAALYLKSKALKDLGRYAEALSAVNLIEQLGSVGGNASVDTLRNDIQEGLAASTSSQATKPKPAAAKPAVDKQQAAAGSPRKKVQIIEESSDSDEDATLDVIDSTANAQRAYDWVSSDEGAKDLRGFMEAVSSKRPAAKNTTTDYEDMD